MNKLLILVLIGLLLTPLITSSCKFDPCGGRSTDKCVVIPSLNKLFQNEFEICVVNDSGEVECSKVLR